ncbi:MAG: WD40 repeat domain-containing protein [Pirellulaceae bacterium]
MSRFARIADTDNSDQFAATAGDDGKICFWDKDGKLVADFDLDRTPVKRISFNFRRTRLAAADMAGKIWIIDISNEPKLLCKLKGNSANISSIVWLPNGGLTSADLNGNNRFWGHDFKPTSAEFLDGNSVIEIPLRTDGPIPTNPSVNFWILRESAGQFVASY